MGIYSSRPCKYNIAVACNTKMKCTYCGWSPVMTEFRRERLNELADADKLRDPEAKKRSCL